MYACSLIIVQTHASHMLLHKHIQLIHVADSPHTTSTYSTRIYILKTTLQLCPYAYNLITAQTHTTHTRMHIHLQNMFIF